MSTGRWSTRCCGIPTSNELAIEAVRNYPNRFAIMGWFYLDDPNGRDLVAHWKERPGMLGLRFYFNERHKREWMTDGSLDWLWPAAEQAGVPVALAAALFLPTVGRIAERHPGLKLIVDHLAVPPGSSGPSAYCFQPELLALAKYPNVAVKATGQPGYAEDAYPFRSFHEHLHRVFDAFGPERMFWGHRHHPNALLLAAMRDGVHRGTVLAEGPRSRSRHGRSPVQLGRLGPSRLSPSIGSGSALLSAGTQNMEIFARPRDVRGRWFPLSPPSGSRFSVASRCGAVAVARTYLWPPLSSSGASLVRP